MPRFQVRYEASFLIPVMHKVEGYYRFVAGLEKRRIIEYNINIVNKIKILN